MDKRNHLAYVFSRIGKRAGAFGVAILVFIILPLLFDVIQKGNTPNQELHKLPRTSELRTLYKPKGYGVDDPRDPRFYNIISEEEALRFEPCQDVKEAASVQFSKLSLTDHFDKTYTIGDRIRAVVTLHDGYGKRKYSGGDHLRATIENIGLQASSPCVITDNRDGTQIVVCDALWSGTSTITVTLSYARETITTIYRIRRKVVATRNINALYENKGYREVVLCHPNSTQLLKLTNYSAVCNMTRLNSGILFYCGRPINEHLSCQNLKNMQSSKSDRKFDVTKCEEMLLKSGQHSLKATLTVRVQKSGLYNNVSVINQPTLPCSRYNISSLWVSRQPTGFFFNGKWNFRNCLGVNENRYMTCLKNRRLYLFGDSTTRAWYEEIIKYFNCQQVTEKWTQAKWKKPTECLNEQINLKVGWYPHAMPFFGRVVSAERNNLKYSTARRIDNIPHNERAIVIVHVYMHVVAYHQSVFTERMKIIRESVHRFLRYNNQSIVMIKAPHTYEDTPAGGYKLSDYFGYVYSKIMYEVFEGLHDRVVLLNNRDTTIAQHVKWNHPPENIINVMIDQMLSYACDS